jgi:hypothetical protein
LEVFINEFGEKNTNNKENFDSKLFDRFNNILNEETVNEIYQELYDGSPYHCIHFGDNIYTPYTYLASQSSGQYINKEIRLLHEHFLESLHELHNFLHANYSSTSSGKEHLIVPGINDGFQKRLKKDKLSDYLNTILGNMVVRYEEYRTLIKNLFFI